MEKSRRHLGLGTKISKRHQITIPQRLMQELSLHPGDEITFQWIAKTGERLKILGAISREGLRIAMLRIAIRRRLPRAG